MLVVKALIEFAMGAAPAAKEVDELWYEVTF
jgi:hypothetical protein